MRIAGGFDHLWVNDVDVAPYVRAELDRIHPERVAVREMATAAQYRAAWEQIEAMWAATVERARQLDGAVAHRRVGGEWSMVQTLRHLVFATDCWVRRAMFDMPDAFHPWGVNHTEMLEGFAEAIGLDPAARPSLDEVLAMRADRMALMRSVLADLTDEQMATMSPASPAPDFPDERHPWRECLRVVMEEEVEHHRYVVRDLTTLGYPPVKTGAPRSS
ncbi:MAG TPA: hypothetical protein DCR14_18785 [Acidimicrobiaceae bacterium]|nr:hypothetical protein [Acidimicrobiaceae bacterium]